MRIDLHEIHGFETPSEYLRFVSWIEQHVAEGDLMEIPVDPQYGAGRLYGGRWFRDVASGATWRLIRPDFPFRGLWEAVHRGTNV